MSTWPKITWVRSNKRANFYVQDTGNHSAIRWSKTTNGVFGIAPDSQVTLLEMDISYGMVSAVDDLSKWYFALVTLDSNGSIPSSITELVNANRCHWLRSQAYVMYGTPATIKQQMIRDVIEWWNPPVITSDDMNPIPYEKYVGLIVWSTSPTSEAVNMNGTIFYEEALMIIRWGDDAYTFNTAEERDSSGVGWEEWQHWD